MSTKPRDWIEARRKALANLEAVSDSEDAALTAEAASDPDNPPADDLLRRRGRPRLNSPKEAVKLRLDPEVLAYFRSSGGGWQTRINAALREAIKDK